MSNVCEDCVNENVVHKGKREKKDVKFLVELKN